MRILTADYIYPIATPPLKKGAIVINNNGTIVNVFDSPDFKALEKQFGTKTETYEGIICPGFINTHCHLELSHMRGKIEPKQGMVGFIKDIITKRSGYSEAEIQQAIEEAEQEMLQNGIVAVGDISNDNSTFKQKEKKNLTYHTFIELFDLNQEKAESTFSKGLELQQLLSPNNIQHSSLVPHAPYTVSEKLLKLISNYALQKKAILSIHNQESETENDFFYKKSGTMYESFEKIGVQPQMLRENASGNSIQATLPFLTNASKILLVHNTFTSKDDIRWAKALYVNNKTLDIYWCTCPNANMYIENKLPDYNAFIDENALLTIGTDSLASNWSLSILDELKTITKQYPQIPIQTLLTWATKNGADFLNFNQLGTFEKGKKPGVNLLTGLINYQISTDTQVKKLV